ncbi:MAG: amidohydrolase family protein [Verrucomicrobiota bacterium]
MIDSHHHLWKFTEEEYGWIPEGSSIRRDFFAADIEAAALANGVDGTVVVQARQTLAETDWLLEIAAASVVIQGVVGWVPLKNADVGIALSRYAANPYFKGVRHVLQGEADEYFIDDDFHRGLALLPDLDLRYDLLLFQRQLPAGIALVDRQPELGIVVDHIAKPMIKKGVIDPAWKQGMAELAKRDNVLGVKISGMVTEVADAEIDEPTLHAYFEETLAMFGADRLMFGTDWPVCLLRVDDYKTCADMTREWVSRLSDDEQHAILGGNAERVYDLSLL